MKFSPYIPLEDAVALAPRGFLNSHQLLFWIRDELIRDTPFRYQDVYDLMVALAELDEDRFEFSPHTIRKVLSWFKKVGHITVLDDMHTDPSQHLYMWTSFRARRLAHVRRQEPCTRAQELLQAKLELLGLSDI